MGRDARFIWEKRLRPAEAVSTIKMQGRSKLAEPHATPSFEILLYPRGSKSTPRVKQYILVRRFDKTPLPCVNYTAAEAAAPSRVVARGTQKP